MHRVCTAGKSENAWSHAVLDDLSIGAHLTSPRRGYRHHGIYAGAGRVIHYGGFSRLFHSRPVEEVSLAEFTLGRGLAVKPWVAPKFSGTDVIARARSRLGENRYRLFSNNCEHFAEWCIGGQSRSLQVDAFLGAIRKRVTRFALARAPRAGSRLAAA
jgi:Lecithin retinol acyltransferase